MRVLVLGGSGLFGSLTARRLAGCDIVSELAVAGRNQEALARVALDIGEKARAVQVDIRDEHRLTSVAADFDIVVNVAAPEWEVLLPALRAAIAAGADYCDIGAFAFTTEKQLELDSAAKERDLVAVVGMGLDPGVDNLLAVHASRKFDRLEGVQLCYVFNISEFLTDLPGALEKLRSTGHVDASLLGTLYAASVPARTYRDGRWIEVDARESPVEMTLPDGLTVTGYPAAFSEPITLPRYLPSLRNAMSVLSYFPPPLNELRLRMGQRLVSEGLTPHEAARSFLESIVAESDRWLKAPAKIPDAWVSWVVATGWKDGRRARYTCWPLGPLYSTSIPLTVATLRILRGEVLARGVLPPEGAFEPTSFFEEAGQHAKQEDRGKPLVGERFEWTDGDEAS